MDNGQMLQVRFISLNLREAGSNDVGRSEIGLFETLGMSIDRAPVWKRVSGDTEQDLAWAEYAVAPEERVQRTLQKEANIRDNR